MVKMLLALARILRTKEVHRLRIIAWKQSNRASANIPEALQYLGSHSSTLNESLNRTRRAVYCICVNFPVPGPIYDDPTDHDGLVLIRDPSIPSHVTRKLVSGFQEFTLVDKEVSCRFRIRMNQRGGQQQYEYRAAAFSGVRSFSGVATGGNRVCAVFACTGDDLESCGRRFKNFSINSTASFEELTIIATVPKPITDTAVQAHDSSYFPVSLDVSIMPLEVKEYTYTEESNGETTNYTFTLNSNKELYTFAVWGRIFERDGLEPTKPLHDSSSVKGFSNILMILIAAFMVFK
ncbi:vanin-like protein 1 [Hyposmocoma kahamanoa]|uniref:vanin-like protein 1 n=1 Tax=Hyposmocoma kahamanoa TaxID=1477025 RepID=UPI000E6D75C7|nr:vanin-like protein 1 [Hyposmocoma kahamanoa]